MNYDAYMNSSSHGINSRTFDARDHQFVYLSVALE